MIDVAGSAFRLSAIAHQLHCAHRHRINRTGRFVRSIRSLAFRVNAARVSQPSFAPPPPKLDAATMSRDQLKAEREKYEKDRVRATAVPRPAPPCPLKSGKCEITDNG